MKYCLAAFLLLLASVPCSALDRNAFTFTNYKLDVRVEPEQQRLAVRGRITLRNDSAVPQKNAVLQISSSLDWRLIQVDGKPVQFVSQPYASDIDHTGAVSEAIVSLPAPLAPKATIEVEVGYEGVIPLDTTRLKRIGVPDDVAKHSDWDQIGPSFTAVRGVGYVAWYPVAMDAANLYEGNSAFDLLTAWKTREQQAEMNVNLCAVSEQEALTILMNDSPARVAKGGSADSSAKVMKSCSEHSFVPLDITVPAFFVAQYRSIDGPAETIFYLPSDEAGAKEYVEAANHVLPLIKEWFGLPKTAARIAELADAFASPFETGSIMLTAFNGDSKLAELSVVHELAHSAFRSPRPWVHEGVAHFAQALWREREVGREGTLDFMGLHRTALAAVEERAASNPSPLLTSAEEEMYRSKALFVWWMLRDMIGQDALKKALASYNPRDDASPDYVQKLVQAQTSRDLQWFFDDWVYHDRGLPDLRVVTVYPSKTPRGIYLVTVTLENLGNAGAEAPFTVRFDGGEITKRLEVRAKSQATTRVEVPALPNEVIVNDGSVPESNMANNVFRITADKK